MVDFSVLERLDIKSFYPSTINAIAAFLFFIECYHIIGHVCVLFRLRLLPRKDLVRIRYYFLADTLTVFVVSFLYTGQLRWLATLQIAQHLFFFLTWDKNTYTRKVISWSSLDWTRTSETKARWEWDIILGTAFDVIVHAINTYILSQFLTTVELLVAIAMVSGTSLVVLYNPRFAWCNPSCVPGWVSRRVVPVDLPEVDRSSIFLTKND